MTPSWERLRPASAISALAPHASVLLAVATALWVGYAASPRAGWSDRDYQLGEFAAAAIRAPYDFSVIDEAATARKRDEAARLAPAVAVVDADTGTRLADLFTRAFADARRLFEEADASREAGEADLASLSRSARAARQRERAAEADRLVAQEVEARVATFETAIGSTLSPAWRNTLIGDRFSAALADQATALIADCYDGPVASDLDGLRLVMAGTAGAGGPGRIVLVDASTGSERTLTSLTGVRSLQEVMAGLRGRASLVLPDLDDVRRELLVGLIRPRLRPSLFLDVAATEGRRGAAAAAVLPVSLSFGRNQLVIGEGQRVTPETRLVLDYLRQAGLPGAYGRRLAATSGLLALLLLTFQLVARRAGWRPRTARRDMLFLLTSLFVTTLGLSLWLIVIDLALAQGSSLSRLALAMVYPLAAPAMLTRLLVGFDAAVVLALLVAVSAGLLIDPGLPVAIHAVVTGALGAHLVAGCTGRGAVIRAGAWMSLMAGGTGAAVGLAAGDGSAAAIASVAVASAAGAIGAALVTLAVSRVAEWSFGYSSGVSLLEMVSYEQPLLRHLMTEAPGTFQHSVSIGVLGSGAAEAIGADALAVRVGALYHDVGKTVNPALFVENQAAVNPHDSLDPEESARLISAHVAEGVRLAREYRLGDRVIEFIREHHGTGPMRFFLARAETAGRTVDPQAFRYPGPRPQSRETALLMIADQVEATSRAMSGAPESELRTMVGATIERLRAEGQLDEAPLTLRDLVAVREALVQMLVGLHHRRIAYPGSEPAQADAVKPVPAQLR